MRRSAIRHSLCVLAVLPLQLGFGEASAGEPGFAVREVGLTLDSVSGHAYPVLAARIRSIASTEDFLLATDHRKLWIVRRGRPPEGLDTATVLPFSANWYGPPCSAGNEIAVPVAAFSEDDQQRNTTSPLGAFRRGPQPRGILVVSEAGLRLIPEFEVVSAHPRIRDRMLSSGFKSYTSPSKWNEIPQSCHWTGEQLVIGAYGSIVLANLEASSVVLVDEDPGLTMNREAIFQGEEALWVALDEGGAGGGCVHKLADASDTEFCLLGHHNVELGLDTIVEHGDRALVSTAAGLIAIDESKREYVRYRVSPDGETTRVHSLISTPRGLFGLAGHGVVHFRLEDASGTVLQISDPGATSGLHALGRFDGSWWVASDARLIRIDVSEPHAREDGG